MTTRISPDQIREGDHLRFTDSRHGGRYECTVSGLYAHDLLYDGPSMWASSYLYLPDDGPPEPMEAEGTWPLDFLVAIMRLEPDDYEPTHFEASWFDKPRGFYRPGEGGCTCWPPGTPDFTPDSEGFVIAGPRGVHSERCAVSRSWAAAIEAMLPGDLPAEPWLIRTIGYTGRSGLVCGTWAGPAAAAAGLVVVGLVARSVVRRLRW